MTAEVDLERFVTAQEADYHIALAEIRGGSRDPRTLARLGDLGPR